MPLHKKLLFYLLLLGLAVSIWVLITSKWVGAVILTAAFAAMILLVYLEEMNFGLDEFEHGFDIQCMVIDIVSRCNAYYVVHMSVSKRSNPKGYRRLNLASERYLDFDDYCNFLAKNEVFYSIQHIRSQEGVIFRLGVLAGKAMHFRQMHIQNSFIYKNFKVLRNVEAAFISPFVGFYLFKKCNPKYFIQKEM